MWVGAWGLEGRACGSLDVPLYSFTGFRGVSQSDHGYKVQPLKTMVTDPSERLPSRAEANLLERLQWGTPWPAPSGGFTHNI